MSESHMKAYLVQDDYGDGGACVRFARHNVVARREGAIELDCEFEDVTCRRYPAFDQYAEQGGVPDSVLVDHGWWFECMQCSQKICSEPYDEDGNEIELTPIYEPHRIYCSAKCKQAFEAERQAERDRAEQVASAALKMWPGITVRHKNGYEQPPRVWFDFPGGQDQADWRLGEDTLRVSARDKAAWESFAEAARAQRTASS